MSDKLRIVGPGESSELLRTIDNGEESYIVNGVTIVSEKTSSPYRPLHCSELAEKIVERNYHKGDTKFIVKSGDDDLLYSRIYEKVKPTGIIDLIDTQNLQTDYAISCTQVSVSSVMEDKVKRLYEKLFGAMKEQEVSFYSLPKKVININDGSVLVDLVHIGSTEYTDTVSLGEVLKFPVAPVESGRVDVGIQYSKDRNIYCVEKSYAAFKYQDADDGSYGSMQVNNIIDKINDDVQIEIIDGDIKVSPLNNDVNECIINNCTVIYGRN